jgi:hypothetical protein
MNDAFNRELERGHKSDRHEFDLSVQTNISLLNHQQLEVYDTLIKATDDGNVGFFVLDALGGTGQTFLVSLILTKC